MTQSLMRSANETYDRLLGDELMDALAALLDLHPAGEDGPPIGYVDGALAGLVLLPVTVPPEEWLAHLEAGPEVRFDNPADGERLIELLLQRKAEIAAQLLQGGHAFEPIYDLDEEGNSIWHLWLLGCFGVIGLCQDNWAAMISSEDEDLATAAVGLTLLSAALSGIAAAPPEDVDLGKVKRLAAIAPHLIPYLVETIYRRRQGLPRVVSTEDFLGGLLLGVLLDDGESIFPQLHPPRVGRNQPCPCGSGKKHKKCCGR